MTLTCGIVLPRDT